jgi:hypothetical protein
MTGRLVAHSLSLWRFSMGRCNGKDTVPHRFTPHLVDKRDYPPFVGHTGNVPIRLTNDGQPAPSAPRGARDTTAAAPESDADTTAATPTWFADFLIDRATRKPSRSARA